MYAYLNYIFNVDARDAVIEMFHNRAFLYRNMITQKMFKKALEQLKPRGWYNPENDMSDYSIYLK